MVIRSLKYWMGLGFCFLSLFSWAGNFQAQVDRTVVTEGDSLNLMLRFSDFQVPGDPDISALTQDFEVSSPSKSSQFQTVLGQGSQGSVEWRYSLTPKRMGILTIPSFELNGERSEPISIKVKPMSKELKDKLSQSLFFDVDIDKNSAFVQEQILYTERIYFSLALTNHQLSPFEVENAVVEPLDEAKLFQTRYQGRDYQVIERRFAIFPQTSGTLVIPSQSYRGEVRSDYFSRGRAMSAHSETLEVSIDSRPSNYPQAAWLPAKLVSLAAQWEGDPSQLTAGEPITLSLILSAEGLSSAQLPALDFVKVKGLKYYREPPKLEDEKDHQGLRSTKVLKIAIIPTESGEHQIPAIRIPWYSTVDNSLKEATLSFPLLKVEGQLSNHLQPNQPTTSTAPQPQDQSETTAQKADTDVHPVQATSTQQGETPAYWLWGLVGLLILSNLVTLALWISEKRRALHINTNPNRMTGLENTNATKQLAIERLKKALQQQQPDEVRSACLDWARAQWPGFQGGISEMGNRLNHREAQLALLGLDAFLFGKGDQWDAAVVLNVLSHYSEGTLRQSKEPLPDLYPKAS